MSKENQKTLSQISDVPADGVRARVQSCCPYKKVLINSGGRWKRGDGMRYGGGLMRTTGLVFLGTSLS